MVNPGSNDEAIGNPKKDEGPVKALLRLTETAVFLRSTDGCFYAKFTVGGRPEIYGLRSRPFRDWLINRYFHARQEIPSDWSMRRVLAKLEASARFEGATPSIFVRVGHDDHGTGNGSACYFDLADPGGHAVRIDPDGWSVVNNPCVHFRHPEGQLPLPIPIRGGSLDLLRPYVNLTDRDFRLFIVWLAAAIRPFGPYPVLGLYGQHGSAKSTLTRIARLLIDPQADPRLDEPRNSHDLTVSAADGWLFVYDNLSVMPRWLSDGLCRLATGGALAGHASSTSGERNLIHSQRPVILNGIEEFVGRSDLIDRGVFLDLPPIAANRRRCEDEFWDNFHQDCPRILGALLDAVAGGLRELPSVKLPELPRMADFGKFAEAVGRNLGWPAQTAILDYNDNRVEAVTAQLEDSPLGTFLLGDAYQVPDWTGAPARLLAEFSMLAGERVATSPRWPKSARAFTVELRRIAPMLRAHGIFVNVFRTHQGRVVSISIDPKRAQDDRDTPNLIADEELGPELETQENLRHGQPSSQV